jgi:hypothetical protein
VRLAFSFGGDRLGQHRPGELPRLTDREACPSGAFAAGALAEIDEDPRDGMMRIAESEPADREFPPRSQRATIIPAAGPSPSAEAGNASRSKALYPWGYVRHQRTEGTK